MINFYDYFGTLFLHDPFILISNLFIFIFIFIFIYTFVFIFIIVISFLCTFAGAEAHGAATQQYVAPPCASAPANKNSMKNYDENEIIMMKIKTKV